MLNIGIKILDIIRLKVDEMDCLAKTRALLNIEWVMWWHKIYIHPNETFGSICVIHQICSIFSSHVFLQLNHSPSLESVSMFRIIYLFLSFLTVRLCVVFRINVCLFGCKRENNSRSISNESESIGRVNTNWISLPEKKFKNTKLSKLLNV